MASGLHLALFIKGLIIGVVIAAPVGPVNILCIQRTLTVGRRSGLISGLGAAMADTVFAIVAGLGLTLVSEFLVANQRPLRWIGGIIIIVLGARAILYRPRQPATAREAWHKRLAGDFWSTFALTITNPITIFSFAAIFAAASAVPPENDYSTALALVLGVFLGSQIWWATLTLTAGCFRAKLDDRGLTRLSQVSGALIVLCGLVAILSVVPPFDEIFVY